MMPGDNATEFVIKEPSLKLKDEDELRQLVGKRADYYLGKWQTIEETGNSAVFNIAAFFFGLFWMIYRKMYLYSFLAIILIVVVSSVEIALDVPDIVDRTTTFAFCFAFAFFGNYLYYLHSKSVLAKLHKQNAPSALTGDQLSDVGGTSWAIVIMSLLITAIAIVFIIYLMSTVHTS